jgi:hypothetical protein
MLIMFVILFILTIFMIKSPLEGQIHVSTHLPWWSDMMKIQVVIIVGFIKGVEKCIIISYLV